MKTVNQSAPISWAERILFSNTCCCCNPLRSPEAQVLPGFAFYARRLEGKAADQLYRAPAAIPGEISEVGVAQRET